MEVEDVDTRHRGSEVPGGRVEAAPLVEEDIGKLHVGRRTPCLAPGAQALKATRGVATSAHGQGHVSLVFVSGGGLYHCPLSAVEVFITGLYQ